MNNEMLIWRAIANLHWALGDVYGAMVYGIDYERASPEFFKSIESFKKHLDELSQIHAERFPKPEPTIADVHAALIDGQKQAAAERERETHVTVVRQ